MERQLRPPSYRPRQEVAADVRQKNATYQPGIIVAVQLWAAARDRPGVRVAGLALGFALAFTDVLALREGAWDERSPVTVNP